MSKWSRDPEQVDRDIAICLAHPEYRDRPFVEALRDLRRRRGEWV